MKILFFLPTLLWADLIPKGVQCPENFLVSGEFRQSRIVGGSETGEKSWKWMVLLDMDGIFCGGTILSPHWVITAAHCCPDGIRTKQVTINLGAYNRTIFSKERQYPAKKIHRHPLFGSIHEVSHDFCLIEAAKEMQLRSNDADIACLPDQGRHIGSSVPLSKNCFIAGWGHSSMEGTPKDFLHSAKVNIFSYDECVHSTLTQFNTIDVEQSIEFCAGTTDGSRDACSGDSGGPLICINSQKQPILYGITSWGVGCGDKGFPGVYAKVAEVINWIKQTTKLTKPSNPSIRPSKPPRPAITIISEQDLLINSFTYPTSFITTIRKATKIAANHDGVFKRLLRGNRKIKVQDKLARISLIIGKSAKINGYGKIISSTKCAKRSIEKNFKFDEFLEDLNKKVILWQNMTNMGVFKAAISVKFVNKKSKFCGILENMLTMTMKYSRNTAWICRSNGHSSPLDTSNLSGKGSLKRRLFFMTNWILKMFDCDAYSVY